MSEKATLIRDIRARLPLVAIGHPGLAAAIGHAMDAVEQNDAANEVWMAYAFAHASELRGLFDLSPTERRVGALVHVMADSQTRLGIVVQMGDEDDHPNAVLVHMEDGPGYPCWWASYVVVPVASEGPQP